MNYTKNCSITKIPFTNIDKIIVIPTLFKYKNDFTSRVDTNVYQLPLILSGKYFKYGMFSFTDNKENHKSLSSINKLIGMYSNYNWMDLNEYCKTSYINVNNEKCLFDFFAINEEIFLEILNKHLVLVNDKHLNYSDFKLSFIQNFNKKEYSDKYVFDVFENYEIEHIATIEFIKNFMAKVGIVIQSSFYIKEYDKEAYSILENAKSNILKKSI